MAKQEVSTSPSAEVVGHAFVEQYYRILHQSPGVVHRFYQDSSLLSRPDANGAMITVTTMQAINEKILSLSYEDYTAEIETADAQESHGKGVIVLVTGCLTGKDSVRKKFTQSFFLAPQDKGYFVLNDVFRYLEEKEPVQIRSVPINGINEEALTSSHAVETEHVTNDHEPEPVASIEEEDLENVAEVCDPSDEDEGSVVEDEIVESPTRSNQAQILSTTEPAPVSQEDAPKQSYASILKVMKSGPTPAPNYPRAAPVSTNQKPVASPATTAAALEISAPSSENAPDSSNVNVEDDGHSIYVRNLPFDATPEQLEEVFKKFGPIKHDGIQVRSNKQGFCFGFVEFETSMGKQGALEASPIAIGDRQAVVEEKKTNTRVSSNAGRGRYSSGRGSFRGDSFRGGRGGGFGVGGGRGGYGRSEFRSLSDFSGRPKGPNPRSGGEVYQRAHQNGSGRGRGGGGGHHQRGGGGS